MIEWNPAETCLPGKGSDTDGVHKNPQVVLVGCRRWCTVVRRDARREGLRDGGRVVYGSSRSGSLRGLEVAAAKFAQGSGILSAIAVILGMLMVAAWTISNSRRERASNLVLASLLSLLVLFYFVMV